MNQSIKSSKVIGNNMRRLRKAAKITQDDLTTKLQLIGCDLTRSDYAKIEAGIRHISFEELQSIKTVLNTTYDELLK